MAQAFAEDWDVTLPDGAQRKYNLDKVSLEALQKAEASKEYAAAIRDSNKAIARSVSIPSTMLPKQPTFAQSYAAACAELRIHPTKG